MQQSPSVSATSDSTTTPRAERKRTRAEPYTICPRCERDCTSTRLNHVCVACERRFQEEMSRSKGAAQTVRYWARILKEAQEQRVRYRGCKLAVFKVLVDQADAGGD